VLEVLGIKLTEAHIGVMKEGFPEETGVELFIERVAKIDENSITLEFVYNIEYRPELALVNIRGVAFCRDSPGSIKKILENWRKKKELPGDVAGPAINMINANVGLNSLFLLRPFDLAPHFMPPPLAAPGKTPKPEKTAKKKGKKKKRGK